MKKQKELTWKEETRKVSQLKPYEHNPRTITKEEFEWMQQSLKEDGYHDRIRINTDNTIVSGHQRFRAMQANGLKQTDTIPVLVPSRALNVEEFLRSLIRANHEAGRYDVDILANHFDIEDLEKWGMDLQSIGIDLDPAIDEEGEFEDEVPPGYVPISKRGDVWQLGDHSLMCGDSTSADDVGELLGSVKPNLMVTDPPYGVEYDANWRNEADRKNGKPYGASAIGKVSNDSQVDWSSAYALFPGSVAYVWHADRHASEVQSSLEKCDFEIRCQIIWAKSRFAISRGNYHWQHEPCWYAVKKKAKASWTGDRSQSTLWQIDHNKSETGHSTQKPVETMRRPVENNSSPGQAVYDPFMGSGTTIIACEQTGRICYGMEIMPEYVDMAIRRWEKFTGKQAINRETGEPFPPKHEAQNETRA